MSDDQAAQNQQNPATVVDLYRAEHGRRAGGIFSKALEDRSPLSDELSIAKDPSGSMT